VIFRQGAYSAHDAVQAFSRHQSFNDIRKNHYHKDVANHDINDAFAVLWTAERIYRKETTVIPAEAEVDSVGLRMGIWY
jgi:predicted RNase H-like nuclease